MKVAPNITKKSQQDQSAKTMFSKKTILKCFVFFETNISKEKKKKDDRETLVKFEIDGALISHEQLCKQMQIDFLSIG